MKTSDRGVVLHSEARVEARQAQDLSRQGNHVDAAAIWSRLQAQGALAPEDLPKWGWDLVRLVVAELRNADLANLSPSSVRRVKRHLNTYLHLGLKGPDRLHSAILGQALRMAKSDQLKLLPFLHLWGPAQFSSEDYRPQSGKNGQTWPALHESVIQAAAKEASKSDRREDAVFILPHVEDAVRRYPENIWLKHAHAKLLRNLGRLGEARAAAVDFARAKATEYWVWELIGDLEVEAPDLQRACYAKALCCSTDEDFIGKPRLKFAAVIADEYPAQARYEVERVLANRTAKGQRVPPEAQKMKETDWFRSTTPMTTDRAFYGRFTPRAEALLFSHLPWVDASVGEQFEIAGRDGQKPRKRRRIYVRDGQAARELSLPASQPDIRNLDDGSPLSIQYEDTDQNGGYATIHSLRPRPEGTAMDAAPKIVGVIDAVNTKKGVLHAIASRELDGTCPIAAYPGAPEPGMFVNLRISRRNGKNGEIRRLVHIEPTDQRPPEALCRDFCECVKITDAGLGFTDGDIFLPPDVVRLSGARSGDQVQGRAVVSYDKKRRQWGWKAVEAKRVGV